MNICGKRVLLIGAGGGIGQAIARELMCQGAHAELGGAECIVADMAASSEAVN